MHTPHPHPAALVHESTRSSLSTNTTETGQLVRTFTTSRLQMSWHGDDLLVRFSAKVFELNEARLAQRHAARRMQRRV